MTDVAQTIDWIRKNSDLTDLTQVTYFEGYLETVGKVVVEVHDRGEDDQLRYTIHARTVDLPVKKTANSNAEADLEVAIATTNWQDLRP